MSFVFHLSGHCFRRTSATWMAENGGTDAQLMAHHGWKNANMVQEYMANTNMNQIQMAKLITGVDVRKVATSSVVASEKVN